MTMPEGTPIDTATDAPADADTTASAPTPEAPKANREARYRVERNQAREALTAAEARVEAYQTRELHRLVADTLANPEDIGLSGLSLADFIGEEGELNTAAIAEAVASVLESRPGLAKDYRPPVGATDPSHGSGNGGRVKATPSFATLLSG